MKVIILAAGTGSRLRPLTDERPKCLVPLFGKPLLEYQLSTLESLGLANPLVVSGHCAHELNRYPVTQVSNPDFASSNMVYSLFCAEERFNDDIIISYGDIVYEPHVLKALLESPHEISVVVDHGWKTLWELRTSEPLKDAETLKLDPEGKIRELGKRPHSYHDIEGQYIGLIKFSRKSLPAIKKFYHSLSPTGSYDGRDRKNMFMTSFLQGLIEAGFPVHPVFIDHGWLEVDTLEDLKIYHRHPLVREKLFRI